MEIIRIQRHRLNLSKLRKKTGKPYPVIVDVNQIRYLKPMRQATLIYNQAGRFICSVQESPETILNLLLNASA